MEKFLEKLKPEDLDERQQKLWQTSLFLGKMLLAGAVFHLILLLYPNTVPVQSALAKITTYILNIVGIDSFSYGTDIFIDGDIYRVTQDCLGWKSMAAFSALVFATSDNIIKHLKFLTGGLVLIAVANLVRILTTVYLSHLEIISFDIIHGTLWKWGLTVVVLTIWIPWFKNQVPTRMSS